MGRAIYFRPNSYGRFTKFAAIRRTRRLFPSVSGLEALDTRQCRRASLCPKCSARALASVLLLQQQTGDLDDPIYWGWFDNAYHRGSDISRSYTRAAEATCVHRAGIVHSGLSDLMSTTQARFPGSPTRLKGITGSLPHTKQPISVGLSTLQSSSIRSSAMSSRRSWCTRGPTRH